MPPRPSFVWAAFAAANLQAACLVVVAVVGLVVSYSLCDTSGAFQSGYCDVRGQRWFLWVGCQLVLLLAAVAVPVLALLGLRCDGARRRLLQVEGVVVAAAICVALMAELTDTASMLLPIGLMLILGGAVVAGMRARGTPATL